MGGAINDPDRSATAFVHRGSWFTLNYRVTIYPPAVTGPETRAIARKWVDGGFSAIDPVTSGETYQNYIDPALADWESSYYAENYTRLTQVKSSCDPYGFFRFPQGINPGT